MDKDIKKNDIFSVFKKRKVKVDFGSYYIKTLEPEEILKFKKNNIIDLKYITAKKINKKNDEESLLLFKDLVNNKNNCLLGLINDQNDIIGRISFYNYNERNRSIELGYILNRDYRGKGLMTNTLKLLLKILFTSDKEINKIYCQTASFNNASCNLLIKCDFIKEGVLRENHEYNGKLFDDIIFGILNSEWKEKNYR